MKDITVVIPICPMPSHPSAEVLNEVVASIRERLPDSEIILMFDGVNPTLMHLKGAYEEYKRTFLHHINFETDNITPLVFDRHMHQSLMLKEALNKIDTPYMLWSEQDTTLHNTIDFTGLKEVISAGYANLIRFSHEASILPDHRDLYLDQEPIEILGQPLLRTKQWSGRPHLARTDFYRELVAKYWNDFPQFIEHRMYGVVVEGSYEEFRLHLYAPPGTYVTSKHLDGRRKGAESYDPNPS